MVQEEGSSRPGGEFSSKRMRTKFIPIAAAAAAVLVVLAVALVPQFSGRVLLEANTGVDNSDEHVLAKSAHSHHRRSHHLSALAREQRLVGMEAAELQRERPVVTSTEDTYVAARARVSSLTASLAASSDDSRKLGIEQADDAAQVKAALLARKRAALRLSAKENVAKEAENMERAAHALEDKALQDKDDSEKDEAEGVAIQQPAAALLKDSKKLNDQSNLVLDQSHSSQAKALAALDLNLAQSLAMRASEGMKQAKQYFSKAIEERKKAVAADQFAAEDTIDAAKVSLKVNHEVPALMHVLHGQETGDEALRAVLKADLDEIEKSENRLGEDREAVRSAYEHRTDTIQQVQLAKQQSDTLRNELVAAEKAVVQAAKSHLMATKRFNEAAAARKEAEEKANELEDADRADLDKKLKAAEVAKDAATAQYKQARDKVESLSGKQTLLQMEVARLKLQLKEAQMQRESLKEKNDKQSETISSLQTHLDEVDGDLNAARLKLADERIGAGSEAGDVVVYGGRGRAHHSNVHDEATQAEGDAYHASGTLQRERMNEQQMQEEQARAEQSARDEERKLKAAQLAVQQQMEKVRRLEASA